MRVLPTVLIILRFICNFQFRFVYLFTRALRQIKSQPVIISNTTRHEHNHAMDDDIDTTFALNLDQCGESATQFILDRLNSKNNQIVYDTVLKVSEFCRGLPSNRNYRLGPIYAGKFVKIPIFIEASLTFCAAGLISESFV